MIRQLFVDSCVQIRLWVRSVEVDAFYFGGIAAAIVFEVHENDHLVFLKVFPKTTYSGVLVANVEYMGCEACFSSVSNFS